MVYASNPYERYREQGVITASPLELIIMLYDGCIKRLKLASQAIEDKNIELSNNMLIRAQDIIGELVQSLDVRYEPAEQLLDLYEFLIHEIARINLEKNAQGIPPVIEILEELRSAWSEVAKTNYTPQYAIEE